MLDFMKIRSAIPNFHGVGRLPQPPQLSNERENLSVGGPGHCQPARTARQRSRLSQQPATAPNNNTPNHTKVSIHSPPCAGMLLA